MYIYENVAPSALLIAKVSSGVLISSECGPIIALCKHTPCGAILRFKYSFSLCVHRDWRVICSHAIFCKENLINDP